MDNFSPLRTTKAHMGRHMDRLASIGMGLNANMVRWNDGGDPGAEAAAAAAAKDAFVGSLPEDIRGNEAIAGFSNVGDLAKAYVDTSTKLAAKPPVTWKGNIQGDLAKAPLLQKYEDTPEGLAKAITSHIELEKLLGNEKVPIPKSVDDKEGWARFSKAMGIPDKPEGYGLKDVKLPDTMKDMAFDKTKFSEIMHGIKATPAQAQGLWKAYTEMNLQAYNKAQEKFKGQMAETVNALKQEWGDAYDGNIELGQTVINKFTDPNTNEADVITALLAGNPVGSKFLAKIGGQFAEMKLGEFSYKRFGLSADQAQAEIDSVLKDPKHPYTDPKASKAEHEAAIDYVNSLYAIINKAKA